ncbi:cupredoxin domain-containing protein [Thiobacillus sp.]|uniref:cupredoxin domain-containing protein n=1 Tax=Thiobacillus sp. TaxID=924 RepID=UPI0025E2C55D|nr:cupredoxin domain-containing protein [Thiobacillus sp.]
MNAPLGFFLMLSAAAASVPAQAVELPVYTLVARDGRFTPANLEVPSGVRFKIVIKNESSGAIEFESLSLRKEKVLGPGAQSFVVIAQLKPGEFDFFDEFHPDTSRGQIRAK